MSHTYEFELKLNENFTLEIRYSYSPGTPDVWYLPNGDPGYPGDPEEISIDFVGLKVGETLVDITELLDELGLYGEINRIDRAIDEDLERRLQDDREEQAADDIEAEVREGREFW